jgi:hypothetical protein
MNLWLEHCTGIAGPQVRLDPASNVIKVYLSYFCFTQKTKYANKKYLMTVSLWFHIMIEHSWSSWILLYAHLITLAQLHWLPISQRIIYKIVLITYKSLNGSAPHYINNMLKPYTPSAVNLRSSSKGLLTIPSVKLVNYGERSFSYAAPKLWNALPEYIRKSETLPIFKTRLKTHLFKQYYD